jgi:uncharacterized delta-60 repeat protein
MVGVRRFLTISLAILFSIPSTSFPADDFDWVKRKRQPFPGIDRALALAVDPMGGILIAGDSLGRGAPYEARAVRLDPAGKEAFSLDRGEYSFSSPRCVGFDRDGNACMAVTRNNTSPTTIEVVKLDPGGRTLWTATYSDPTGWDPYVHCIAVGADGRVAVAGTAGHWDFFTALFDPAGNLLWTATRDGPKHKEDEVFAVAIDPDGNVYVTGWTDYDDDHWAPSAIVTIKYDPSGAEVWTARYDGDGASVLRGTDIAVGEDGSVYVAGKGVVLRYGPGGDERWSATFEAFGPGDEAALAVGPMTGGVLAAAGNEVIRLTPDGIESWSTTVEGMIFRSVGADREGNVLAAGKSMSFDFAQIAAYKWTPEGEELWSVLIGGADIDRLSDWDDPFAGMAIDGDGNLILAGTAAISGKDQEFIAAKIDPQGAEVWQATSGTARTTADEARAVAIDAQGNIVAAGALARECGTVRYAADGTELWAAHGGIGYEGDGVQALALDASGGPCVTGRSGGKYLTVRYDRDGNEVWRAVDDWPAAGGGAGYGIVLDAAGNATVAGSTQYSMSDSGSDFLVIRYDAAGGKVWRDLYGGSGSDVAWALALDGEGNTIVAGTRLWTQGDHAAILKYDPSGARLWDLVLDRGFKNTADAVALDPEGNIYMTGSTYVEDHTEAETVKYDPSGLRLWTVRHASAGLAYPTALVLDGSFAVYVAEIAQGEDGWRDFSLVKYDASGNILCSGRADAPPGWEGVPLAMCLDAAGNVHLAGRWFRTMDGSSLPAIASFDPAGNLIGTRTLEGPGAFSAIAADAAGAICAVGSSAGDFVVAKFTGTAGEATRFRRGDANADGELDLSDGVAVLVRLFLGGGPPPCDRAFDADGSGAIDITDAVSILEHLFLGGKAPPEPFASCGAGPLPSALICDSFPPCAG